MKNLKISVLICLSMVLMSCSVQQFSVNTDSKPFENKGKVYGEKTKDKVFEKTSDLHVFGMNVKINEVDTLVKKMGVSSYTIETKSNMWLKLLTLGIVDYKIVKVISRE